MDEVNYPTFQSRYGIGNTQSINPTPVQGQDMTEQENSIPNGTLPPDTNPWSSIPDNYQQSGGAPQAAPTAMSGGK